MKYKCGAEEQFPQPVLLIHTTTPVQNLPQTLGQGYQTIMEYLGELQNQPAGAPFVAYYNMDMANLDIDIGFPVNGSLPAKGSIQSSKLPAGRIATCEYTGPYPEMAGAYDELNQFIKENGYEPTGVVYEFYLNEPGAVPPEELKTRIVFILKN